MNKAINIVALIAFGFTIYFGLEGLNGAMVTSMILVLAFLFFANLDKISEFKAGKDGFEAKTRKVIDEAKVTTKELKELAKVLVENQVTSIIRNMRLGTYSDVDKEKRKDELLDILRNLKLPEDEISETLIEWNRFTLFDYASCILGSGQAPVHLFQDGITEWKALRHRPLKNIPMPEELRSFLKKYDLLTKEREERIKDYEYFLEEHAHRRPEEWSKREGWDLKK